MTSIFKKIILLWTVVFTPLLFADGAIININIDDVTANESAGTMTFTISLSESPVLPVTVDFNTIDGSAQAGTDYVAKSDYLVFGLGISSRTFTIDIINDGDYEPTQNFYINMSSSSSGYVSSYDGTGTITDDDVQPLNVSVLGKSITEGDTNSNSDFTVQLNQPAPTGGVTVNYTTANYTGGTYNSAVAGDDYTTTSGSITINAGSSIGYISIPIIADMNPETTEAFMVNLTSVSQGSISTSEAVGIIYDDDAIQVSISVTDTLEGNTSDTNKMPFKIFLTKPYPLTTPLTIDYQTQDGFAPSAIASSDYTTKTGSVTFNSGDSEKLVYVDIIGDNDVETDENLEMVISGSSYIITGSIVGEILNDDGSFPGLSFTPDSGVVDFEIVEGNSSQSDLNFRMILDAPALPGTSFGYYTQNGTATVSKGDYIQVPLTTYNVPVGATSISLPITINGDTDIEGDEYFYFRIKDEVNLNITGHLAIGKIINDDGSYPILSFNSSSYETTEGNSSSKTIDFQLQLDKPALPNSSFDYYTTDGTATIEDNDYVEINRTTYTFSGGEQNITIPVTINGDSDFESMETFYLEIDNEINMTIIGTQSPSGVILNDDTAPLVLTNVGEFRFDNCGADEWKIDSSSIQNNAIGTSTVIDNDDKAYMCTSLNGYAQDFTIPHHSAYELDEGTISIMLYDHHNTWNTWLIDKGAFSMQIQRVNNNPNEGTITATIGGNTIATNEVYFTSTPANDGDFDTQWIMITFTFGSEGMKLYINGELKGTNPYTGGIASILDDFTMTKMSGYFDEFYIFKGAMTPTEVQNSYSNIINNKNLDGTLRDCGCGDPNVAFSCDNSMYLSSSIKRGTGETGKMWLHKIDTSKNPFEFIPIDETGETKLYNALAYADSGDSNTSNYIFGIYNDDVNKTHELIKLSATGKVINLGVIGGFPATLETKQLFAGAIYGDFYYVSGPGVDYDKIFKIDLRDKSMSEITLNRAISLLDFSFTPDGSFLHGIIDGGELVKIDINSGVVTTIGSPHSGYQFDSTFSDKTGRFFANDSKGNGFFEFNLITGNKLFLSNSQEASFNDGANCLQASLLFTDYGDAPLSYGSPRHNIANGVFMGDEVDHDIASFHSDEADGDDNNGTDDEDGVTLIDGSSLNNSYFPLEQTHELKIKVSKDGYLNMWIDFDADGIFDSGDQIITAGSLSAGEHTLTFTVPSTANTTKPTYMRFRFSSTAILNPTEGATDGEVEDYMIHLGSEFTPLRGLFNIERTNSGLYPIDSDARNAWYTQIVGRDFNYSILFYEENLSAQKEIDRVSVKIELVNMESNTTLYERYAYIKNTPPVSRIDVTLPTDDLATIPATKDARFRISYGVESDGSIIQADCTTSPQTCYEALPSFHTDYAKDNFSIRPETFYVTLHDRDRVLRNSRGDNTQAVRLATGYEYNLTVIATQYKNDNSILSSQDYNTSIDRWLRFKSTGVCRNSDDNRTEEKFQDGNNTTNLMKFHEVGLYSLEIEDGNWTKVDQNLINPALSDCLMGVDIYKNTPDLDGKVGCNIVTQSSDINISFQPYKFEVTLEMEANNIPNSSHPDFLYMMNDINSTQNDVAIQFEGEITAMSKGDINNTNFTVGCVANDINLSLIAETISEDGINQIIRTSSSPIRTRSDVNLSRVIRYNKDINNNHLDINRTLKYIDSDIIINKDKFLEENNGSTHLQIRYNLNKNMTETINPVQITFNSFEVNSSSSFSEANESTSELQGDGSMIYYPLGHQNLGATVRNFYFSQVSPDAVVYPMVNCLTNSNILTPVNVDIFCDRNITYCTQTGLIGHTQPLSSPRASQGWYISTEHNQAIDGGIVNLIHTNSIRTTPDPDAVTPLEFTQGRNGLLQTKFRAETKEEISILPHDSLLYNPNPLKNGQPTYEVSCSNDYNGSQWTGIGKTGNVLNINSNLNRSHKMDW